MPVSIRIAWRLFLELTGSGVDSVRDSRSAARSSDDARVTLLELLADISTGFGIGLGLGLDDGEDCVLSGVTRIGG